jgi:glycosyltransferase involved in cell wall biosynthesis
LQATTQQAITMEMQPKKLSIVIPTYKRAHILKYLLNDLLAQTMLPDELIIVDGDPESEITKSCLFELKFPLCLNVLYIPSNHANAPYQRYLGAKAANDYGWVIFIDDDIRIVQNDALEKIMLPFTWGDRLIVGVSPKIIFPLREKPIDKHYRRNYLEFMKSSFQVSPGELTPSGDRVPLEDTTDDYVPAKWLRGGVMAFQNEVLSKVIYSEDVFALSHIHCGLGADDTYLSRCVGLSGYLLQANCAIVEHPDKDISKVYPADTKELGYARAYSRRLDRKSVV